MLLVPSYLSGMDDAAVALAKRKLELYIDPQIKQAMEETAKAHTEAQAGWARAITLLAEGAGLTRYANGWRLPAEAA